MRLNVELAAPDDFIPVAPGWEERSRFVAQEGPLTFLDYDLVAQALAKIERGHAQDREDVAAMLERGLITPESIRTAFTSIEPALYRYPAIDASAFRQAVEEATR